MIVTHLKKRYDSSHVYTYMGDILIAINPYRDLQIYGEEVKYTYMGDVLIASNPYRDLQIYGEEVKYTYMGDILTPSTHRPTGICKSTGRR